MTYLESYEPDPTEPTYPSLGILLALITFAAFVYGIFKLCSYLGC